MGSNYYYKIEETLSIEKDKALEKYLLLKDKLFNKFNIFFSNITLRKVAQFIPIKHRFTAISMKKFIPT